jgi:hypothetical protein
MGWVAIPLAVLGLSALSGGGSQECVECVPACEPAHAAYGAAPGGYGYAQAQPQPGYYGASQQAYHNPAHQGHYGASAYQGQYGAPGYYDGTAGYGAQQYGGASASMAAQGHP